MNGMEIEHPASDHLPVLAKEEQSHAFKQLKAPLHGRRLHLLAHLIGDRLVRGRQLVARLAFGQGMDQQGQHHGHRQCHHPLGALEKQAVGKKERDFEEAESSLHRNGLDSVESSSGARTLGDRRNRSKVR